MKVLAFSDMHHSARAARALVEASRDADLVIGAGDFCNRRRDLADALELLSGISVPMVLVPGNNESEAELRAAAPKDAIVLHGQGCDVDGMRIFGLGYAVPVTPFTDWSCDLPEERARELLANCGEVDILISHSPPKEVVDRTSNGLSLGSVAVLETIERAQPGLVMCGHIHDCWGQSAMVGASRVVNLGPTANWFEFD
ncbi:metallophosphoesterase family protein [Shimia aestuarii]|uniref:Predicted phosphoesterase n=1 Tax=Shimia aestuarii TaxID=254406 RepID=A0A1I4I0E7_9RHOB|nr:metallophosphoesterase family protein [Shimia aestuarii]SFL47829.1 Predicted phosphoesterase [Shimia aestuarii]